MQNIGHPHKGCIPIYTYMKWKKQKNTRCNEKKLKVIYRFNIIDVYRTFGYWKVLKGYEKLWLEYVSSAMAICNNMGANAYDYNTCVTVL